MKFLAFLRSFALLIARVVLGGILIAHGWDRWQVRKVTSQIDYLQQYGVPYAEIAAWGATILELVGGIFLIVGALTPLVALAILAEQVLIVTYISWRNNLWLLAPDNRYVGGYEYNLALGALALLLAVFGAGAVSIDRLFRRSKPTPEEEDDTTPAGPVRNTQISPVAGRPATPAAPPQTGSRPVTPAQSPQTLPQQPVNHPPSSMSGANRY